MSKIYKKLQISLSEGMSLRTVEHKECSIMFAADKMLVTLKDYTTPDHEVGFYNITIVYDLKNIQKYRTLE